MFRNYGFLWKIFINGNLLEQEVSFKCCNVENKTLPLGPRQAELLHMKVLNIGYAFTNFNPFPPSLPPKVGNKTFVSQLFEIENFW